jgi:UDP-N-acetylmuramoylalanine--D-glutamate ligase
LDSGDFVGRIKYRYSKNQVNMKELVQTYQAISLAEKISGKIRKLSGTNNILNAFRQWDIPGRMQKTGILNGKEIINDSAAANINATYFSLQSIQRPVVWIIWNNEADAAFEELDWSVMHYVKKIVVVGKAYLKLEYLFGGRIPVIETGNLQEALQNALQKDNPETKCILFSPATNVFEGKINNRQAGELFENIVKRTAV